MRRLVSTLLALLALSPSALGVPISASDAQQKTWDYIVVGGGLGGLVVANRLSDTASVLVIEAGSDRRDDPLISDPYQYGAVWNPSNDLAWTWSTPQGRSLVG